MPSAFHAWAPPTLKKALTEIECPLCVDTSLASLCSRRAFFLESDSTPCSLPLSSEMSELMPAQTPRFSLSPPREVDPVFFSRADQHPSAAASDIVSFGVSDDEILNDTVSLSASDADSDVLSGSIDNPALPRSGESSEPKPGTDANLFHVLSKAVDKLGLEWSPPEEPTRSRLDEWFLPGTPSGPSPASFIILPGSSRRTHHDVTRPLLCPPTCFLFIRTQGSRFKVLYYLSHTQSYRV